MYSRLGRKDRSAVLREVLRQRLEREDRKMLDGIDLGNIYRVYDAMNERWWSGKLELKSLKLDDCGPKADGWYIPYDSEIIIDKALSEVDRAGVLLHEMCHLAVDIEHDYINGLGDELGYIPWHGSLWKKEMKRVGYTGNILSTSGEERFGWYT